jgi:predicted RecA/RadA family phage recombinase
MKNFIAPGEVIAVVTPAGGYVAGTGYVIGGLFGIAVLTTAEGEVNQLAVTKVFELPSTGSAIAVGDIVYFNNTTKVVTKTKATGLFAIGYAVSASVNGLVEVRLGRPVVAEA